MELNRSQFGDMRPLYPLRNPGEVGVRQTAQESRTREGYKEFARKSPHTDEWWHGTQTDFEHFDEPTPHGQRRKRQTDDPLNFLGTHFGGNESTAEQFANRPSKHGDSSPGGYVWNVALNAQHPARYQSETNIREDMARHGVDRGMIKESDVRGAERYRMDPDTAAPLRERAADNAIEVLRHHPKRAAIAKSFASHLQEKGFDSIIYHNNVEGPPGERSAVVFDPKRVRRLGRTQTEGYAQGEFT